MLFDATTNFGARVQQRLINEKVLWLTTVRSDGMPQPSPVWFLWDGTTMLVYSKPNSPRVRNIAQNPNVAVHFDSNGTGGDIIILSGTAQIDPSVPPADQVLPFFNKYHEEWEKHTEPYTEAYHVAIRITPVSVRGFLA